eukprot:Sspe_Gene.3212::Locus_1054_Transcript_1_1_Confidence_1.000_Length_3362::g.3212::m.3212
MRPANPSDTDGGELCDTITSGIASAASSISTTVCSEVANLTANLSKSEIAKLILLISLTPVPPRPDAATVEHYIEGMMAKSVPGIEMEDFNGMTAKELDAVSLILNAKDKQGKLVIDDFIGAILPNGTLPIPIDKMVSLWNVPKLSEILRANITFLNASLTGLDTFSQISVGLAKGSRYTFDAEIDADELGIDLWMKVDIAEGAMVRGGVPISDVVRLRIASEKFSFKTQIAFGADRAVYDSITLAGMMVKGPMCLLQSAAVDITPLASYDTNFTSGFNMTWVDISNAEWYVKETGLICGGIDNLVSDIIKLVHISPSILSPLLTDAFAGLSVYAKAVEMITGDCLYHADPTQPTPSPNVSPVKPQGGPAGFTAPCVFLVALLALLSLLI